MGFIDEFYFSSSSPSRMLGWSLNPLKLWIRLGSPAPSPTHVAHIPKVARSTWARQVMTPTQTSTRSMLPFPDTTPRRLLEPRCPVPPGIRILTSRANECQTLWGGATRPAPRLEGRQSGCKATQHYGRRIGRPSGASNPSKSRI